MRDVNIDSLAAALDIAIKRIDRSLDESWLIMGPDEADEGLCKEVEFLQPGIHDYEFQPAHHCFTEICMCVAGNLALKIGEHYVELKEGYVGVILPGVEHCEVSVNKQDYMAMWLVVDTSKVRLHLSGYRKNKFYTSHLSSLKQWYEYNLLLDIIKRESRYHGRYFQKTVKACLLQMYIFALREVLAEEHGSARQDAWRESVADEIKKYIDERGLTHVKVRDISQEVCISESHMNNIFKSVTGMTVVQYIENQRVQKAKVLLRNAALTIDCIATQLGYYDRYHFSKAFKKATGCSPGLYRKNC